MKKNRLLIILFLVTIVINSNGQIASWTQLESGTNANLYGIDFLDENIGIAVGEGGTILRTYDGGNSWESIDAGVSRNLNAVNYCTDQKIVIVGDSTLILRSEDGGETWSQQTFSNLSFANLLSVDINENGKGIVGGLYQTIMTTEDFGASWLFLRKNFEGVFFSVRMLDEDNAFVFGKNGNFMSIVIKIAHLDSISTSRFYCVFNGDSYMNATSCRDGYPITNDSIITIGEAAISSEGCAGYITRNQSWANEYWNPIYLRMDYSYYLGIDMLYNYGITVGCALSTKGGWRPLITETCDQGKTWNDLEVPYYDYDVILWQVKVLNSAAYCVGDMGIILKTDLPCVKNNYERVDFCNKIYPNPASETCKFSFFNNVEQEVNITLYNSEGKLISEVYNGFLPAGQHEFNLPVRNKRNGLYYCSLRTKTQISTTKFNIINN